MLIMCADASFAGNIIDSKSTSGGVLCIVGPRTFVLVSWVCKKQGAISHSSTEAEVIALEMVLRMEGIPALDPWELIVDVFSNTDPSKTEKGTSEHPDRGPVTEGDYVKKILVGVDDVPTTLPPKTHSSELRIWEHSVTTIEYVFERSKPSASTCSTSFSNRSRYHV